MARRWLQRNIIFTMWPHWPWFLIVVLVQKDYWLSLFPGNFHRCPIFRAGRNWSTCKSLCSNKEGWRGDCSWIHISTSMVFHQWPAVFHYLCAYFSFTQDILIGKPINTYTKEPTTKIWLMISLTLMTLWKLDVLHLLMWWTNAQVVEGRRQVMCGSAF